MEMEGLGVIGGGAAGALEAALGRLKSPQAHPRTTNPASSGLCAIRRATRRARPLGRARLVPVVANRSRSSASSRALA